MTAQELINDANKKAQKIAELFADVPVCPTRGWTDTGSDEYRAAHMKAATMPRFAETDSVICESVCCFKGVKPYFQNRFYIRKENGRRGKFSKAEAVKRLG